MKFTPYEDKLIKDYYCNIPTSQLAKMMGRIDSSIHSHAKRLGITFNKKPHGTLCWSCKNATGGCKWSQKENHGPVKGWEVKENMIDGKLSYRVIKCPEFVEG